MCLVRQPPFRVRLRTTNLLCISRREGEVGVSASGQEGVAKPPLATWQRRSTAYLLSQAGCGMQTGQAQLAPKTKPFGVSRNRTMFSQRFG